MSIRLLARFWLRAHLISSRSALADIHIFDIYRRPLAVLAPCRSHPFPLARTDREIFRLFLLSFCSISTSLSVYVKLPEFPLCSIRPEPGVFVSIRVSVSRSISLTMQGRLYRSVSTSLFHAIPLSFTIGRQLFEAVCFPGM